MKISNSFVPRVQNDIADKVAKWAVNLDDLVVSDVMPDLLLQGFLPCGFPALL